MTNLEKNFNDKPIASQVSWANSQIDNSSYVQELVNKIEEVAFSKVDPIGITIALTGPIGSGKSSIVNMAKEKLLATSHCMVEFTPESNEVSPMIIHKEDIDQYIEKLKLLIERNANYAETVFVNDKGQGFYLNISDFSCYWFSGDEKLALSFISHISSKIGLISEEAKKLAIEIGAFLVKTIMPSSKDVVDFIKKNLTAEQSLDDKIKRLDNILRNSQSKKRFLIVLDDLDRMEPNEILAIFRIIKTFGNLRNVMFLLVYDDDIISDVANKHFPAAQGKYIDKFIQLRVNVLPARRASIVQQTKDSVLAECGLTKDDLMAKSLFEDELFISEQYFDELNGNLPNDNSSKETGYQTQQSFNVNYLISNNLHIPRSITLIKNEVSASWEHCKHLVCIKDLLVMAILKTYNPNLYQKIYDYCDAFSFDRGSFQNNKAEMHEIPFVGDWRYEHTPLSFSLANPTLMSLYFFGSDSINKVFKQDFPSLAAKLSGNKKDWSEEEYEALIASLIHDFYAIAKDHLPKKDYCPIDYEIKFNLKVYLDNLLLSMLFKADFKDSLTPFLEFLFSKMASKTFIGFAKTSIKNATHEYNVIASIQMIREWSATLIVENENHNELLNNSQLIQHLAQIEDKDYLFFIESASAYTNEHTTTHSGNDHVIYKCYLESLYDAIVSGTIFKSNAYSYYFLLGSSFIKLPKFDQKSFPDLYELFSSIKCVLQQKFHDKQVDDTFLESLIFKLSEIEPTNPLSFTSFDSSFIGFYELNPKDLEENIEDYLTRLESAPTENEYFTKTTTDVLPVLKHLVHLKNWRDSINGTKIT